MSRLLTSVVCLYLTAVRLMPAFRIVLFVLMIRRPPRSTLDRSSAASDVYKRQHTIEGTAIDKLSWFARTFTEVVIAERAAVAVYFPVSYTHLRAHETVLDLVCRLLLEKKNKHIHHEQEHIRHNTHSHLLHEIYRYYRRLRP